MSDLNTQLSEELADIEWNCLIPHAKRDAIIIVNKHLNLVEVGSAIANDQVSLVQHWIAEQLLQKPTTDQLNNWNGHPETKFSTLIVQPFVLVHEASA